MEQRTVQCAQCGADVDSIGVGRPRKYCDQCRPRTYKPKSHTTVKQCPNCGTQFETPNRERIYCSRACAAAVRMANKTNQEAEPRPRGRRKPTTCSVEGCDTKAHGKGLCSKHYMREYYRERREHPGRGDRCSEDGCDRDAHAKGLCQRHYQNWRKQEQISEHQPLTCEECGIQFSYDGIRRKYCSTHCQRRALVDHGPATCTEEGCARAARSRGLCMKHLKRVYVKEGRITPEPWDDRRRANYQARRARKAGATIGVPVVASEVYERDNWTCQLCGEPVAREVRWPDPMSPSLDHRVPLAKGGEHSMDNVQLAHLHCNVSKGARVEQATVVA